MRHVLKSIVVVALTLSMSAGSSLADWAGTRSGLPWPSTATRERGLCSADALTLPLAVSRSIGRSGLGGFSGLYKRHWIKTKPSLLATASWGVLMGAPLSASENQHESSIVHLQRMFGYYVFFGIIILPFMFGLMGATLSAQEVVRQGPVFDAALTVVYYVFSIYISLAFRAFRSYIKGVRAILVIPLVMAGAIVLTVGSTPFIDLSIKGYLILKQASLILLLLGNAVGVPVMMALIQLMDRNSWPRVRLNSLLWLLLDDEYAAILTAQGVNAVMYMASLRIVGLEWLWFSPLWLITFALFHHWDRQQLKKFLNRHVAKGNGAVLAYSCPTLMLRAWESQPHWLYWGGLLFPYPYLIVPTDQWVPLHQRAMDWLKLKLRRPSLAAARVGASDRYTLTAA